MKRSFVRVMAAAALLAIGYTAGRATAPAGAVQAQGTRVFEMRTYVTPEGKLPNLNTRFREHTMRLFTKHGMTNIGYWTPMDAPASQNTLVYLIAHESREAAKKNWDAFRADPDWQKVRKESEAAGPIVSNIQSMFLTPTDYSQIK